MAQRPKRPRRGPQVDAKSLKRNREVETLETLSARVNDLEIRPPTAPTEFADLPLSQLTQAGLKASHFTKLTSIQATAIPASLKGRDVLGAAKTGSGKTLAFLVPVLDNLYRKRWTQHDGLGALILSPTRELAIQIFDVLRAIGRHHTFSAGLVIGGKFLKEERDGVGRMNILVATPGRILQHMDQTADLDVGNLQMLVLDEADRIMDMGFRDNVDAIIEHLPSDRQTLMFSATQTRKIEDLTRLALKEPEFVSAHETADTATPATLQQNYVVAPLPEKLDVLWSFLRANTKKKILVFLSSGKQVRFVYEAFRRLQPGVSLLHLHGRQKQTARLEITKKFSNSQFACLFATDVAARGLDFPAVDWVVQVDCPEDADTYIHRVGRTARYEHEGHAIMLVDPSEEEGMLATLQQKKVNVEKVNVKQRKMQDTLRKELQNKCFEYPNLKYLGQKAFVSYVRSIYLQKDKATFKLKDLDLEGYAASMGLPGAPKVKFLRGQDAKSRKNMPRALAAMEDGSSTDKNSDEDDATATVKEKPVVRTKYDRMFERRNQDVLADHYHKLIDDGSSSDSEQSYDLSADGKDRDPKHGVEDDFLSVKRRFVAGDEALGKEGHEDSDDMSDSETANLRTKKKIRLSSNPDAAPLIVDSKRREKLLKSKKKLLKYKGHGSHLVFDDDGDEGMEKVYYEKEDDFAKRGDASTQREKFVEGEMERAKEADSADKAVAKAKRREKKVRKKERERRDAEEEVDGGDDDDDVGVRLVPYEQDEEHVRPKKEKKHKKWFEDNDEHQSADRGERQKKDDNDHLHKRYNPNATLNQPQTLEDLEAMAAGLLGK